MDIVRSSNILQFLIDYFHSIGINDNVEEFFSVRGFRSALILKLPVVCLMPDNKPAYSSSHQTHIHVTGESREFFYTRHELDSATSSSSDLHQPIAVSRNNIRSLTKQSIYGTGFDVVHTFTVKKIGYRSGQDTQVQLSKIREDGSDFINLRKGLFVDDLLIFLSMANTQELFAVGVPYAYYRTRYYFPEDLYFNFQEQGTRSPLSYVEKRNEPAVVPHTIPKVSAIPSEPAQKGPDIKKGDVVTHKAFGKGTVQSLDANGHITICFDCGEKTFKFPDAFTSGFLKKA